MFKAVCTARGGNVSCIVHGKALVEYELHKPVRAPRWLAKQGYHLLVFKRLPSAIEFCRYHMYERPVIYRCRTKGTVKELPPILNFSTLAWGEASPLHKDLGGGWPKDTAMVKEVTLVKRVRTTQQIYRVDRK